MTPSPNYYPELFCQNCDEMGGSFYYDERTETSLCSDCKIKEATQTERDRILKEITPFIERLLRLSQALDDSDAREFNMSPTRLKEWKQWKEIKEKIKEADHE